MKLRDKLVTRVMGQGHKTQGQQGLSDDGGFVYYQQHSPSLFRGNNSPQSNNSLSRDVKLIEVPIKSIVQPAGPSSRGAKDHSGCQKCNRAQPDGSHIVAIPQPSVQNMSPLSVLAAPRKKQICLCYLQCGKQVKKALLPKLITDLEAIRRMFLAAYPSDVISQHDFDARLKAIYIKDPRTEVFYELENIEDLYEKCFLAVKDIQDQTSLNAIKNEMLKEDDVPAEVKYRTMSAAQASNVRRYKFSTLDGRSLQRRSANENSFAVIKSSPDEDDVDEKSMVAKPFTQSISYNLLTTAPHRNFDVKKEESNCFIKETNIIQEDSESSQFARNKLNSIEYQLARLTGMVTTLMSKRNDKSTSDIDKDSYASLERTLKNEISKISKDLKSISCQHTKSEQIISKKHQIIADSRPSLGQLSQLWEQIRILRKNCRDLKELQVKHMRSTKVSMMETGDAIHRELFKMASSPKVSDDTRSHLASDLHRDWLHLTQAIEKVDKELRELEFVVEMFQEDVTNSNIAVDDLRMEKLLQSIKEISQLVTTIKVELMEFEISFTELQQVGGATTDTQKSLLLESPGRVEMFHARIRKLMDILKSLKQLSISRLNSKVQSRTTEIIENDYKMEEALTPPGKQVTTYTYYTVTKNGKQKTVYGGKTRRSASTEKSPP